LGKTILSSGFVIQEGKVVLLEGGLHCPRYLIPQVCAAFDIGEKEGKYPFRQGEVFSMAWVVSGMMMQAQYIHHALLETLGGRWL